MAAAQEFISPELAASLAAEPHSYTFVHTETGEILACAGARILWEGRGETWAFFSRDVKPHMVRLTRVMRDFLHSVPLRRVEASVIMGYRPGHRFAHFCGFEAEGVAKKFDPQGRDHMVYSITKDV